MKFFKILILTALVPLINVHGKDDFIRLRKYARNTVSIEACVPSYLEKGVPFCQYIKREDGVSRLLHNIYNTEALMKAQELWLEDYGSSTLQFAGYAAGTIVGSIMMATFSPVLVIAGTVIVGTRAGSTLKKIEEKRSLKSKEAREISKQEFQNMFSNSNEVIITTTDLNKSFKNISNMLGFYGQALLDLECDNSKGLWGYTKNCLLEPGTSFHR